MRGILTTFCLAGLLILAGCSGRSSPDPVVIGHIESRSGADRLEGDQSRHALLLGVEANKEIVPGRKLQVLHVDGQTKPNQAHAEAIRLLTVNKAGALIADCDAASAMRIAEAANEHQVAVVTPASLVRLNGLNNLFSLGVTAEFQGSVLGRYADEELKAKKAVVLVDTSDPLCVAIAEAIRDQWPTKEPNVVALVPLPEKTGVPSLPAADVYFFAGPVARLTSVESKPLIYAGPIEPLRRLPEMTGRTFHTVTLYEPPSDWNAQQQAFAKTFREKFRVDPDETAFAAADCATVLFEGMKVAKVSGPKLREEIGKLQGVPSLSGALSFEKQHAKRPLHIVEIKDRQAKLVKSYGP